MTEQTRNLLISLASHMAYMQGKLEAYHDQSDPEDFYWYRESVALRQKVQDLLASEADGPAVPEGREPVSVAEQPSDEQLLQLALDTRLYRFQATAGDPVQYELTEAQINAFARAVLARWGTPNQAEIGSLLGAATAPLPVPVLPDDALIIEPAEHTLLVPVAQPVPEEAANPWKDALIDALVCAFLLNEENQSDPRRALHDLISWEVQLARDPLISPPVHPAPVPVSERLPGPEDCDAKGACWVWHRIAANWGLYRLDPTVDSHWLPATALPLPAFWDGDCDKTSTSDEQ